MSYMHVWDGSKWRRIGVELPDKPCAIHIDCAEWDNMSGEQIRATMRLQTVRFAFTHLGMLAHEDLLERDYGVDWSATSKLAHLELARREALSC